jgi:glycosyltransferase involved in cell wall biosynthesis
MPPVAYAPRDQPTPATLSACVIARNEEQRLPDCLASVGFCQEIVLVDSGSTDATTEIARAAGARVVEQPWLGFAAQRNVALDHATGEWVLEIDADERVSPQLRREIERFLADPPDGVGLAGLPLREIFLGRALGLSAKYPKYRHRLLRRGTYRHDEARTVHEGFIPQGLVQPLEGDLIHLLATSWSEAVGDAWRYARLEAGQLQGGRSPAAWVRGALVRPAAKLLYRIVIDGGWRDGWPGLARISLDCVTDTAVWTRHLLGRRGSERGRSGVAGSAHYGSRRLRRGSLRVVGVAADPDMAAVAERWLACARATSADVVLIGACPAGQGAVRVRSLRRLGPLALIRALDAEDQLRPIDAVVAFGSRARLLLRGVPPGLRGEMPEITQETDPRTVNWRAREHPGAETK